MVDGDTAGTVGGGEGQSRQTLSVAFVALQVVGPPRLCVVTVIGVYGMVVVAADLFMPVLVPPLPSPLPRLRLAARCQAWWSRGIGGTSKGS